VGPQASGYPDRRRDQGRRRHPAQHHQAPGAGVAACEHRSPKAWNCSQAGEECRASVADGDPRRPGASLTPSSGRSAGVMLGGHNERPHLRFSRISIARCADPDPLPRVCLGLSRHLQSTSPRGRTPPAKGPRARDLWLPPWPAGGLVAAGGTGGREVNDSAAAVMCRDGRCGRRPAHRDASRLGEPVQLVGIRLANLPENRRRWDQIPPLPAQELAYPPPSAASAHMPARRSGRPTGR
jgi:hypothetical protein